MAWKNPHRCPTPVKQDCGNKVGWHWYDEMAEAVACSKWAKAEAAHKASLGYDFGYQTPGEMSRDGKQWKVVIP